MKKSIASSELDRNNPAPLYEQVKARLLAELRAGGRSTQPLSDSALVKRVGVSRMTVRSAVAELVREGRVKRVPGVGTFLVQDSQVAIGLDGLQRFFQEWHLPELDPGTQILAFRHVAASATVAASLQIAKRSPILLLRRLRTAQGEPVTLDVRFVAGWCASQITREDAAREMLFDIVAMKSGVPTVAVEQEVGAQAADEAAAEILKVPVGSPLLSRAVKFFTTGDRPYIAGTGLYRSDRFRFQMRAER